MTTEKSLLEFMEEAELDHYYQALKDQLKINAIHQLKYVEEEDLNDIGMTKPEMRRLKKMYKKEFPAGALGKLKKAILTRSGGDIGRSLSPSPPEQRSPRPSSYIRPPCKQIIPANSIQINKTLGEGEFGVVQQGLWTTETGEKVQVAIKCLTKEKMHTGTTEFLKEANIMQNVDHENIVRMYGVVLDKDDSLMLVTELAPMRSLLECLKEQSLRTDFPLPRLCDFAQEICDGMSYLESKRLIHRDLAARNILVFSKSKVKISDFGLSRALGVGKDYYQSNFSLNLKLPIAWCAPECINYLKFTSASDIWAFGVTLWELFTYGFQPWAGLTGQQILESIDAPNCQRLERPDLCPKEYYQIMTKCWEHDPERRPLFSELFVMLPQMRPVQVKAMKDFPEVVVPKDFLYYKSYDVIYVLDKNPEDCPKPGFWKGVLGNGKCGYFDPANAMPIIEHKNSPSVSKSINRKESKRENGDAKIKLARKESDKKEKSPKKGKKESNRKSLRKFNAEMISGPQNDLRHTGHIGYDGAIFGDVGFIGDNYDKLPVKVASTGKEGESRISTVSLNRDENGHNMNGSLGTNGHSWISQESIDSQFVTRTDEVDSGDFQYQDIDDDSIFADFKMPDISSSFDFGPSFMDEVLKAINDKEAKLANSSSNDSSATTTPQHESPPKLMMNGRGSKSPPPPLPVQPPRLEPRSKEPPRPEPRKQAKVKPMSASDEKMIDDAIAMANELSSRSHMSTSQEPSSPDKYQSDSESDSGSPQNGSRFKFSFKRSPKFDRQRTFSEEIKNKADQVENVPPGAMEAYNQLVMRGSVKEKSGTSYSPEEREVTPPKREVTPVKRELTPVRREITSVKREIIPAKREITPAKREITPAKRDITPIKREVTPERREVTPVHQDSTYGVPLAMIDDFDLEPPEMSFNQFTEMSYHQKPVPKPRPDSKRSEIPIPAPKPRPEIIQRVEPVPRPQKPPPEIPQEYDLKVKLPEDEYRPKILDTSSEQTSECDSEDIKNNVEVLRIDEPDSDNVHTDSGTESVNSATEVNRQDDSRHDSYNKSTSLFVGEDFSEPSPREIMNKLARESRIRRSLDHQRGVIGSSEEGPSRNIREPQGIPGKGAMSSSNGGDEDVETNPLRMLRGGAIPIRGGRVGQGRRTARK
ncbi:activated Cdc42 kinase-like isoform X16 [Mytilus californianus]|uniref:activated Cdc42 kinase-like isoform X16 n=1 Tax=Mytilus californianus TaxID=6549 RepID=UPI0022460D2B|nr:activated Cdc42 kinase-like isoform X16 [Mytilus californianus]